MHDDTRNPWLPIEESPASAVVTEERADVPSVGPTAPQAGVPAPDWVDRLRKGRMPAAPLFIVGAHGGSGETSLASLHPSWQATGHQWPIVDGEAHVVVAARSSMNGMLAAQRALTEWASGELQGVSVLGLVIVADAPGRQPRALRDMERVVAGGAPRHWSLPWIDAWRLGETPTVEGGPRPVRTFVDDLSILTNRDA